MYHKDILLVDDSGADARCLIAEKHYDCMLIDYRLPDADGLSLMENIHADTAAGCPGLVIISGEGNERVAAKAIKLGAHDYLAKSQLTSAQLQQVIDGAIRRAHEKRSRVHQQLLMENFASTAAHDLANPLNGVIGFISLAQQMMDRGEIEQVPDYLESALILAHYMKQLVVDLLHFARTGSSAEPFETVDQLAANFWKRRSRHRARCSSCSRSPALKAKRPSLRSCFRT